MSSSSPLTIVCLASYEKGHDFLRECKRQGCRVFLVTSLSLKDQARWPVDHIDEIFYMRDEEKKWDRSSALKGISYLARNYQIDRIVPLDDFDLEMAAFLREHLRIPGMGESTTRYFRDKLAMRVQAREAGLNIPEFVHVLNHSRIDEFLRTVPPPWVLKPRLLAGAIGIKKIRDAEEAWKLIHLLGDEQSFYLLERYVPGEIFHVDSVVYEKQILFALASGYGAPPMDVSHHGGVFSTRVLERGSSTERSLIEENARVLSALGLLRGVSHTEFIRGRDDGKIYFLETSARVGGAHIAELVEAATGINLWAEWAKIEIAGGKSDYRLPEVRGDYAGLLVSLAKQEFPDMSSFTDPEVVWRMNKRHHVGLIARSPSFSRVNEILDAYIERVQRDFFAWAPPGDFAQD
ncbi:MAG TPA: ATP-grasp domain-containing protein [Bryobacteraceae bacterium]|jgi:biotin carboxylase|nr:ATP-grasp domain-containing protein [Bryobacteraceae bacterium]